MAEIEFASKTIIMSLSRHEHLEICDGRLSEGSDWCGPKTRPFSIFYEKWLGFRACEKASCCLCSAKTPPPTLCASHRQQLAISRCVIVLHRGLKDASGIRDDHCIARPLSFWRDSGKIDGEMS